MIIDPQTIATVQENETFGRSMQDEHRFCDNLYC